MVSNHIGGSPSGSDLASGSASTIENLHGIEDLLNDGECKNYKEIYHNNLLYYIVHQEEIYYTGYINNKIVEELKKIDSIIDTTYNKITSNVLSPTIITPSIPEDIKSFLDNNRPEDPNIKDKLNKRFRISSSTIGTGMTDNKLKSGNYITLKDVYNNLRNYILELYEQFVIESNKLTEQVNLKKQKLEFIFSNISENYVSVTYIDYINKLKNKFETSDLNRDGVNEDYYNKLFNNIKNIQLQKLNRDYDKQKYNTIISDYKIYLLKVMEKIKEADHPDKYDDVFDFDHFSNIQTGGGIFTSNKIKGVPGVIAGKETSTIKKMFKNTLYSESDKVILLKFLFHSTYDFNKVFSDELNINDDEIEKFFNNYIDRLMKLIGNNINDIINGSTIYSEIAQVLSALFGAKLTDSTSSQTKSEDDPETLLQIDSDIKIPQILSKINERKILGSSFFFNYKNKSILNFIFKVYENINSLNIKLDTVDSDTRKMQLVRVLDEKFNKEILGKSINYKEYDSYKKNENMMAIIQEIFGSVNIYTPKNKILSTLDKEIDKTKNIGELTQVIKNFFDKSGTILNLTLDNSNVCFNLNEESRLDLKEISGTSSSDQDKIAKIKELEEKVKELQDQLNSK